MTDTTTSKPTPTLQSQVLALAQQVRAVRDVVQSRGSFSFDIDRVIAEPQLFVTPTETDKPITVLKDNTILVIIEFGVQAFVSKTPDADDPDAKPYTGNAIIEVFAAYSIQYDLANTPSVSQEVLDAFGRINATFNLTAYWREFVHSCCSRAGVPPMPVPPYNGAKAIKALEQPQPTT